MLTQGRMVRIPSLYSLPHRLGSKLHKRSVSLESGETTFKQLAKRYVVDRGPSGNGPVMARVD